MAPSAEHARRSLTVDLGLETTVKRLNPRLFQCIFSATVFCRFIG